MNAPYWREFFSNRCSIHAKTKKELFRALDLFDEVEDTINSLNVKEGGEFIKAVVSNNDLKIDVVFHGKYLIER